MDKDEELLDFGYILKVGPIRLIRYGVRESEVQDEAMILGPEHRKRWNYHQLRWEYVWMKQVWGRKMESSVVGNVRPEMNVRHPRG